jgi:CRP-like cAMP-binding protein
MTIVEIISSGDIFGESALLGLRQRGQTAVAMEPSVLMSSWTADEVEAIAERSADARKAFIQMLVQRCVALEERLEALALWKTRERLMWALLRFAERMGKRVDPEWVRIPPFTHQLLAEYIGTSREIVTSVLGSLRRQGGYVRYTRRHIDIRHEALQDLYKLGVRHSVAQAAGAQSQG